MSKTRATLITLAALIFSAGLAHAIGPGGRGIASINGGPNEHARQAMNALSYTSSAASGFGVKVMQGVGVCFNATCTAQIQAGATAVSHYNTSGAEQMALLNTAETRFTGTISASGAGTKGTKTLVAGSATQTVLAGAQCVCSNTSTATVCVASVTGTTATFTSGAGTDVVAYICL